MGQKRKAEWKKWMLVNMVFHFGGTIFNQSHFTVHTLIDQTVEIILKSTFIHRLFLFSRNEVSELWPRGRGLLRRSRLSPPSRARRVSLRWRRRLEPQPGLPVEVRSRFKVRSWFENSFFILFPIKPFFNPRIGFWASLRLIDGLKEASVRKNIFSRLQIYFQMAAPIPDEGVFELCKKQ